MDGRFSWDPTRLEPATGIPQRACGRGPSREPCRTSILIAAQARQVEAASSFLLTKKQDIQTGCPVQYGAGYEARTRYLHLGKVALYQMS